MIAKSETLVDTKLTSWYVTADLYAEVERDIGVWRERSARLDPTLERDLTAFLTWESKLLDEGRLRDWVELFADDCVYWMGVEYGGGKPAEQLCTAFDDRRRLEDRVVRLETGTAYSQMPASRTCRTLSQFEFWRGDNDGEFRVRCSFHLFETRNADLRPLSGWYGFVLRRAGSDFVIVRKQIDLLESDVHLRNVSFIV